MSVRTKTVSPPTVSAPTVPVATIGKPDMGRIKDLNREVLALEAAGTWDYQAFLRILDEAGKAANGQGEALGFLFRHATHEWRQKHWGIA